MQIVLIHGGDAYETYDKYIESLKSMEFSLERLRTKGWKSTLALELGPTYDILQPKMPNPSNARYLEWKILFEKMIPQLNDKVIVIGHSLGGIFLAKYLTENEYPKAITATILIAAPYSTKDHEPIVDFTLSTPLTRLQEQGGKIILYHSKDDVVVPYTSAELFLKELPNATLRAFEDHGHFNGERFPELIEDIRQLVERKQ